MELQRHPVLGYVLAIDFQRLWFDAKLHEASEQ